MIFFFSVCLNLIGSTYIRAADFGRYFPPKSTLRFVLESTYGRVYTIMIYVAPFEIPSKIKLCRCHSLPIMFL